MPVPDDLGAAIPIIEESVTIDKAVVQTDAVRIRTFVDEHTVMVEDTLRHEGLKVTRFPVNRAVAVAPPPREEGETTIISLVEERVVVEKRLFVVEEVHVTRERTQEHVAIPVTLRAVRAEVERASDKQSTGSTTDD